MSGGHAPETPTADLDPSQGSVNDHRPSRAETRQDRHAQQVAEHDYSINSDLDRFQATNYSGEFIDQQTLPPPRQQHSTHNPGAQPEALAPEELSSRSTTTARPAIANDRNIQQGFRPGDLVIDMFLPHPRARVEDSPIYRVMGCDPKTFIYRLHLHRDPTGRAPLWTSRNWGEIRLVGVDESWAELLAASSQNDLMG